MDKPLLLLVLTSSLAFAGGPAKGSQPPRSPGPEASAMEKLVRGYVRDQQEEEGSFSVEDDVLGRTWELHLLRVRTEAVTRLPDGRFFVCVDFKGDDEKSAQPVDLDFVVVESDGEWAVDEVLLHKVSGKPRFNYDKNFKRVPVKAAPKGKKPPADPEVLE
ncbi:MAG: hypothetical protein HYV15_07905 [Elusimicrobia bacterium]|nr:hypothetical protein [Elusimicrobiota bacterium]